MTSVKYVTKNEMIDQTGMDALGYAKPKNGLILLLKGMPKDLEMKVRRHESEHIKKGEEGPFLGGAAAAMGAGSLISGYLSYRGARAQEKQGKAQLNESRRQFDLTRQDTAPYREAGQQGVNYLQKLLLGGGQVTPEMLGPGYKFRVDQGQNALTNLLNRTGMKRSGRAMKEITRFGQGEAAQGYENYLSRLFQLSGFGPQGVGQSAGAGARLAGSPAFSTIGNAQSNKFQGINNAVQGGLSNFFAYKQNQDMMKLLGGRNA